MAELLVQPYRAGNEEIADQFCGLLSTYPNSTWIAPSLEVADLAATADPARRHQPHHQRSHL
jgi:hypothetical protein